jgi:hypothetical protein
MLDTLRAGVSYDEAAEQYEITPAYVRLLAKRLDPALYKERMGRPGRPRLDPAVVAARADEREQRSAEIAERMSAMQQGWDQRRHDVAQAVFDNPTTPLAEIGAQFGVSGERARQCANEVDPDRYKQRKLARRDASKAARRTADLRERRSRQTCKTCGGPLPIEGNRTKYCTDHCRDVHNLHLRYHIDDGYRLRHHVAAANWTMNNLHLIPEREREIAKNHAQRVLAGEILEDRGRWLVAGSKAMDAALECYEKGWPIFDRLPEEVQKQVIDVHKSWQED